MQVRKFPYFSERRRPNCTWGPRALALEGEVRDEIGRERYERADGEAKGYRNGYRPGQMKTAEGMVEFSAPQVRSVAGNNSYGVGARSSAVMVRILRSATTRPELPQNRHRARRPLNRYSKRYWMEATNGGEVLSPATTMLAAIDYGSTQSSWRHPRPNAGR